MYNLLILFLFNFWQTNYSFNKFLQQQDHKSYIVNNQTAIILNKKMSTKQAPFAKGTEEATKLHDYLVTKKINMEAEPHIISKMFPNIANGGYSASKIKGGVTRVKKEARATMLTLSRINVDVAPQDYDGKFLKLIWLIAVFFYYIFFH